MVRGADFEIRAKDFLEWLFQELGFTNVRVRQQTPGTQNGFDLRVTFHDSLNKKRELYFECKDYSTPLHWDQMLRKVHELRASSHQVDGFIGLSPHRDLSNINVNVQNILPEVLGFPVHFWTPESGVREYFSLDKHLFKHLYGTDTGSIDVEFIKAKIKTAVQDILHEKDALGIKGSPLTIVLTLKIPKIDPDNIIGRAEALQELHELLFNHKRIVVVNGLGGIGKTTLAQGYLSKYYDEYKHVAWISQSGNDLMTDIAGDEGLVRSLAVLKEGKDARQIFYDVLYKLKSIPDKPNLLILDNADSSLSQFTDLLPGPPHWHLLATSREKIEDFHVKELDFLSPAAAMELFKKYCAFVTDEGGIADLLRVVDYHTLTIEILAKTAQMHHTDIGSLKTAIEQDLRANVATRHSKDSRIEKVRSYLSSIFNLSKVSENATWLMKYFACLPPEYHRYKLLEELINPEAGGRKDIFSETLTELARQGWLLYDAKTDSYKMHRIIREVAVKQLPIVLTDVETLVDSIKKRLNLDQAKDNPVDKFQWIPFGKALAENFPDDTSEQIGLLENNLGITLRELGDLSEAKKLLEKVLCTSEKNLGTDHPSTATYYSNLASVLQDLGQLSEARKLMEKALSSNEKNFGPDHPSTAISYSNLAVVLKDLGELSEAKKLLEKVLRSDEKNFGPDHPSTAISYSNLALVLKGLGQLSEARKLLEKVISSDEKNFGADHPSTARGYSNLAMVLKDLGQLHEARKLLEKVISSDEKNFGADHPSTAITYSNLASVLLNLGELSEARKLLEKAISSDEKNFGADHPSTAASYSNLAMVLLDLGQFSEARKFMEKAISSDEKNFGADHPSTARSYSNLALVLQDLGQLSEARKLLEKALTSDEKNFGPDHSSTAICYSNLAMVLQDLGEHLEALKLAEKGLAIFEKVLPAGHPHTELARKIYQSIKNKLSTRP